jgi:hypothetical protein
MVFTYIHIIAFRRSTESVVQTVGHETCQKKTTQTKKQKHNTKKRHNTKQDRYTDVDTTVSKYKYFAQHNNRMIQYKSQQK